MSSPSHVHGGTPDNRTTAFRVENPRGELNLRLVCTGLSEGL
jgi:hypothetical protein